MPAQHNNFDQYCKDILTAQHEVFNAILAAPMPGLSLEQIKEIKRRQRAAVFAFLFGGPQAFLLTGDFMTSQEPIQRAPAGMNALLAQRSQDFFQDGVRPHVRRGLCPVIVQRRTQPATNSGRQPIPLSR